MSDELAPLFESRETRMGRLPVEARTKLEIVAAQAKDRAGFEDQQFVSLWLSRRTGLPRTDILNNFDQIASRFFGPGATASTAYDAISKTYGPAPAEKPAEGGDAAQAAPAKEDAEYVPGEGLAKVGQGFFGQMLDFTGQSGRSVAGGFEGFAQQVPAGLYSQAAAITSPFLKTPEDVPEYLSLKKRNETLINPYQFTQVSDSEPNMYSGPGPEGELEIAKNSDAMMAIVKQVDAENRAMLAKWAQTKVGAVSQEYRRLADFWYKLSDGAMDRWGVQPDFRQSTVGQFMASAGSVPATAALAALGPGGWIGMEGSFFAQVESERQQQEGAAYDPTKALPANLASAVPQMVMERALGVERLMNSALKAVPKQAGKVLFGDYVRQVARQSLVAAVEEGVENPSQGFWNDYMASMTYDQQREVLTGEGAKRRLVETVSGFVLGGLFGGGITTAEVVDTNRKVARGQEYLTTKDGQPLAAADFQVLRSVHTDQEILAKAADPETGKLLLSAANGNQAAQAEYNKQTLAKLFVKTEGQEVAGLSLGQVNNVPVVRMQDGTIVPLDMTKEEDQRFVQNVKNEVARQTALAETVTFLQGGMEAGRTIEVSQQEKTLQDFVNEAKLSVTEAATRIGIAQDVNGATLPEGVKPEDVRVLGTNLAEYSQGIYKDVSHVYAGGNALTAIEEVAEGYIKKRLAVGDVAETLIAEWRAAYEAETGDKTTTEGRTSDVEWFSKRVVDYAVANRKALKLPAALEGFFRTLGEHLKTVFRLSQRLAKMQRNGKLDPRLEAHIRGALGLETAQGIARAEKQAQYESLFPAPRTSEGQANAGQLERLKAVFAAQDAMIRLAQAESAVVYGIRAELSPQAQRIADAEGYGDLTFSLAPLPDGQLIAVHNTSAEKVRHVAELGGKAVPSVAVIRPGVSQFTSFGDITIILPPAMVNPQVERAARVFNADVYSPRFPQNVRYQVNMTALRRAWDMLGKASKELGFVLSSEVDHDEIERKGLEAFQESSAAMVAYLKSKGIKPDVKNKAVEPLPPEMLAFKGTRWEIADNPEFAKVATAYMREQLKGLDRETQLAYFVKGKLSEKSLADLAQSVVLTNNPEVDRYATAQAVKDQITIAGLNEQFVAWVKETFGDVIRGKVIRDYNERTDKVRNLPYNLDTVVQVMKRGLRDGEGFNYGVASIRSNVAQEFKTVAAMKKAGDQIITHEQMEKLKEETNEEFLKLANELAPFYRFESNRFGFLDEVSTAFKELATQGLPKWQENFKDTPDALLADVRAFLAKLRNMPTEYFEAKIQRGVRLEEMAGAIIPSDTPDDVRAILEKAGLRVIEYPKGDNEARMEAMAQFTDMTFALTGIPQNQEQSLQAQAQRIQARRAAAAGQLLAALQSGQTVPKRAAMVRRTQQASLLARVAVPLSSRLAAISPGLKNRMRQFEFGLSQALLRDMEAVTPFLQAVEKMKENDAAILDLALKNGDAPTRDAILAAYNLGPAFARVQAMLDQTRQRAVAAGYDVGEIAEYFPRYVLDVDGLMNHYYGQPQAGHLEKAVADAAAVALAQGRVLTLEDRIEIVNTALRGYGPKDSRPAHVKGRKTDVVDMDANVFYSDPAHALVHYVETMNAAIEKKRFFGKYAQNVAPAGPGLSSRINLDASIGGYVEALVAAGEITRAQQREVSDLLEARFNQQASSDFIKAFKTLGYITTMGKITSAITQVQDLAFSLYENGVFDTMVATGRAAVGKSKISRKALGIDAIADEFRDPGKLGKLLQTTFTITGLRYMDGVGKEAITNAKFSRMSREAAAGKLSPRTQQTLAAIFDPATRTQVVADLAKGLKTEDTLFAVWNVLADYQPIVPSEYPEAYLRHPNGRVFYMLKSYTLKQIDSFRREGITLIVNGNAKQKAVGFRNLAHLAGLLFLVGVPVDWIKDFIMGRDPQLPDIAVDNVFKLLGVSRWNLWNFRDHKDPIKAAMELVTPPAPFLSYPIADVFKAADEISKGNDIKPGNFESWRMLPFFGDPIYWLLGGGRVKVEKRRIEREKELTGRRIRSR